MIRKRFIALGLLVLFGPLDAGCWMAYHTFKWFIAANNNGYSFLTGAFFFDFSIAIVTIVLSTLLAVYFIKKALPKPQNPTHAQSFG